MADDEEDSLLRSAALQNVHSILRARQRAEQELLRTKEALEEETRILDLLNQTGTALASNLDLPSVLQTMTDAATKLGSAEFGAFYYAIKRDGIERFSLYALSGAAREPFERAGDLALTPLLAPTYHGEGPVRIAQLSADPRAAAQPIEGAVPGGHLPLCSYLAVPVVARSGQVIGGLFFGHRECDAFTSRTERVIVGIAAQAAIAIDNAQLYEEAKRSAAERTRLYEAERAARAEVERVSLLKDEFLSTLSHELRTPLSAILGWSQVLLARLPEDSNTRHGLSTIARNARAQAQLIDDLLDVNRIVSGRIRLDVQRVDLEPVIEAALDSARPSADAKQISLQTHIDAPPEPIFGDPSRLQQIAWNLLSNAVKFTPKGGRIDLSVHSTEDQLQLVVRDNGIGISPEFLPQLFQRFRQADSSSTRSYGGLGLGLSIVKQLVEMHGGSVYAESEGLGRGATFTVSLPLRSPRDLAAWPSERPTMPKLVNLLPKEVSLGGLKVLLIDDEPDALELVRTVLLEASAKVTTAGSADEGLAAFRAQPPDIIVSDIGLPQRDGYSFIREVRELAPSEGGKTPAIALTAFARSEDRTRAMLAGYQVHMSKPVEPRELVAAIHSLAINRGLGV